MNSKSNGELTMEALDVVVGGQTVEQAVFGGMVDGFEKAGGDVSCHLNAGHDQCNFSSGGNSVTVTSPMI